MRDVNKLAKTALRVKTLSSFHVWVVFTLWGASIGRPEGLTKDELYEAQTSEKTLWRFKPPKSKKAVEDAIFELMNWPWQILDCQPDVSVPALPSRAKNRYSPILDNLVADRAKAKLLHHVYLHRNEETNNTTAALMYTFSSLWPDMGALKNDSMGVFDSLLTKEYLEKKVVLKYNAEIGEKQKIVVYKPGPRLVPELRWIQFMKDLPTWG